MAQAISSTSPEMNDYSIPPEAVGQPLTLMASDTTVRIVDGAQEIARHPRTYDRQKHGLAPLHQGAVLKVKRKAFHATPAIASYCRIGSGSLAR